ncbi:MAG: sugar phosphate isomerase/epimerase [Lentisphaeria bacterium]|nr:sugar phosphate isomerase/epimerase [Lentisphaeria bacterium]
MSKPIVAAQMYTCREFCKTPADIVESLKKVADIGYTAIQDSGMGTEEKMPAADLKKACDDQGLVVCATHISFDDMRNDLQRVIDNHLAMDCKYAGIGGAPADARVDAASWSAFAKEASEVGLKLAEHGIRFIYHNHSAEFAKMDDGRTIMQILFEDSDPDGFFFEPDLYWVAHGGASPVAWLKKLAGRCDVIHLKDFAIKTDRTQFYTEIGEGNLDWPTILSTLEDSGVKWMPVEQDTCPGNPFDSLAISYRNLSSWGYK